MKVNKDTKISFKLEGDNEVLIIRNGKTIGKVWSQFQDSMKTTPYPHNDSEHCLNSVQICGFDSMSEVWACGPFQGKRDCVINFMDLDNKYYSSKEDKYKNYVQNILNGKCPIQQMQSFTDWARHQI